MKGYTFTVTITEGCDEWWEVLEALPLELRLEAIKEWLNEVLEDSYIECTIKNGTYYQMELGL